MKQTCSPNHGYAVFFENTSYNCPALKLYGYSSEAALHRAMNKIVKARKAAIATKP